MSKYYYAVAAVAAVAIPVLYHLNTREKKTQRKRKMSFTSTGLGLGSFPPEAEVKDPNINTAIYFDDCPAAEDVAESIIQPLLVYERFSQVPDLAKHIFRPSTREVKPIDLVRQIDIDGDEMLTNNTIVDKCQAKLGEGRDDLPWWEILIVRNSGSGSSACVLRVHHVIGDGLALVSAFQKILKNTKGTAIETPLTSKTSSAPKTAKKKKNPFMMFMSLIAATAHCLTLAATKHDDDTAFSKMNNPRLRHSGKRDFLIFPTIPLDFVKKIKTAAEVTINDLCMAAVSHAIYCYCKSQNDPVLESKQSKIQCRALLPVGFPCETDGPDYTESALTNAWCMASCEMGVGYSDITDRLQYIKSKTQEMKEKPRAYMQLKIQNNVAPLLPVPLTQKTVFDTFSRHSLVLTNVPGLTEEVVFGGKVAKKVQLFFDNLITQVSMITYAGNVYGNIVFDAKELPNLENFGKYYAEAFVDLAAKLNVEVPPEVKKAAART